MESECFRPAAEGCNLGPSAALGASSNPAAEQAMEFVQSPDPDLRIQGAREIRRLAKSSRRSRRRLAAAISPLAAMLSSSSPESAEAALLALLNLAVKDESNKISIVDAGALPAILSFLKPGHGSPLLQEHAAAALLTLSASPANKTALSNSGAIPLLVDTLRHGSTQARADAVLALHNLSADLHSLAVVLSVSPIPPLVSLLKLSGRHSRTSERCSALIEAMAEFEEGRAALAAEEGGVLAVVEALECGSLQGREHAAGTLLALCEDGRRRYREAILGEGAIPGLLELTVKGGPACRAKARRVLQLLRESPRRRCETRGGEEGDGGICGMDDGEDRSGKARRMVAEMVKVSMEQSLRHLQQRAGACGPNDLAVGGDGMGPVSASSSCSRTESPKPRSSRRRYMKSVPHPESTD